MENPTDSAVIHSPDLRRLALRQLLPLGISAALLAVLWERFAGLDLAGIISGVAQVSALEWLMAAGLTAASFWAVGRYDAVVHRITGTGVSDSEATRAGATAIAIAQTVGFGVVSGALVRWRMLPGLSLLQSIRLALTVSLSFLAGWAVVAAAAVLVSPTAPAFAAAPLIAATTLAAAAAFALLALLRPGPLAGLALPSLRAMGTILILALVDTLAAAGALYALLPASVQIDLLTFFAAFVVALGAGLILGTPGGVGPFEVTLIALLPHVQGESLLAAVLAFRVVYYAAPALIGAALVIRGPRNKPGPARPATRLSPASALPGAALDKLLQNAPEAEAALLRHDRLALLHDDGGPAAMVRAMPQSLVMLRGPLRRSVSNDELIRLLETTARGSFLTPCLYKAPARLALAARRAGWQVLAVAREAWLNPQTHRTEGRAYRQLRRKLRKAALAGVVVTPAPATPDQLPLAEMAGIAREWAAARGGERGFSMGVYEPATLTHARVFLAHKDGRLVGFLTLHENPREQVLDLMRHGAAAPDGTMHLLLEHAIAAARAQGHCRLSLAAVPVGRLARENPLFGRLRRHLDRVSGAEGLRQFKTAFAPQWQTLYLAAPHRAGLPGAAIDIGRAIAQGGRAV